MIFPRSYYKGNFSLDIILEDFLINNLPRKSLINPSLSIIITDLNYI